MNKKTLRIAGLGTVAFALATWMAINALSTPPAPVMIEDGLSEIAPLQSEESLTPPRPLLSPTSTIEEVQDEVTQPSLISPVMIEKPVPMNVTFALSSRAKTVLEALEETYVSQVNEAKLAALVAEKNQQKALDALATPKVVHVMSPPPPTSSVIDRLIVKSIVSTPIRITAWIELDGQTAPVSIGTWIDDVKAHNITKDFVRFLDKQGQGHTKYVETHLPITQEAEHGQPRRSATQ